MPRKRKTPKNKNGMTAINKRANSFVPPKKNEPGAQRCLVIDGMNLAYMAYYAHSKLSYMGRSTSILFGLANSLKSLILSDRPEKIIVCWDGEKDPERLRLLPEYKSHRKANMTERERKKLYRQVVKVRKLLYYLGIPQVHNEAIEGDDMIHWVVREFQNLFRVRIVSADKDFGQEINHDVDVWNPRSKYSDTIQTFLFDYKVEVWQFVDYLCLTGDNSDDIPGYRGIGPVRAAEFLKKFGSVKAYLQDEDAEFPGLSDKDKLREIWKRNRLLIDLKRFNNKFHSPKVVTYYRGKRTPQFNKEKFVNYCKRFNLKTFQTTTFQQPFIDIQNG